MRVSKGDERDEMEKVMRMKGRKECKGMGR